MSKYTINNDNRTVIADFAKMSDKQKDEIKELCSLGYTFVNEKSSRKGGTKRTYFENNLYTEDFELFEALAAEKKKGAYAKAASFGRKLIALGKFTDGREDQGDILEEYRTLALVDLLKAKHYADEIMGLKAA